MIHLNGSHPETLRDSYQHASEKLQEALLALQAIDVHGRDYYPISSEAASIAMNEHRARYKNLVKVQNDLDQIVADIDRQIDARRRPETVRNVLVTKVKQTLNRYSPEEAVHILLSRMTEDDLQMVEQANRIPPKQG